MLVVRILVDVLLTTDYTEQKIKINLSQRKTNHLTLLTNNWS
jgi:hypothetical protein